MAVARVLSSQKPGERESWRSVSTLYIRFSTSKKPPQDNYTVPHNFNLFLCHSNKNKGIALGLLKLIAKLSKHSKHLATNIKTTNLISRILFLNYHLSGPAITGGILLPTLDPFCLGRIGRAALRGSYMWHYSTQGLPIPFVTNRDRELLPHIFTFSPDFHRG